jgi:ABC-type sugar transport system permease subunit
MATRMYSKVFEEYNVGYGTAIAVLLFIMVLLATLVSFRLLRRERLEY